MRQRLIIAFHLTTTFRITHTSLLALKFKLHIYLHIKVLKTHESTHTHQIKHIWICAHIWALTPDDTQVMHSRQHKIKSNQPSCQSNYYVDDVWGLYAVIMYVLRLLFYRGSVSWCLFQWIRSFSLLYVEGVKLILLFVEVKYGNYWW